MGCLSDCLCLEDGAESGLCLEDGAESGLCLEDGAESGLCLEGGAESGLHGLQVLLAVSLDDVALGGVPEGLDLHLLHSSDELCVGDLAPLSSDLLHFASLSSEQLS
jgi:hypothetical protein